MIKDYIIKERLGIGAFGVVYKVLKKSDNNIYVIKQIPLIGLTYKEIKDAELEAKILSSVKSNYIVRYFESFEENLHLNIVMEYCDGGDLGEFLNKNKKTRRLLKEDLIWNIFLKITIGLATLHKSKILHRDLKTLNIFLTKNLDVKIGDFGVAKILTKSGFANTMIGTPYYLSPELCNEKPYNDKSDVWALGCILYELSTYRHPFNAKCQASLILKILQNKPLPIHKYYSSNLQNLIYYILEKNYLIRPSCYDILHLPYVVEKAKKLGLYDSINILYPTKSLNNIANKYDNKTYISSADKKKKSFNANTAPKKVINKNYNKINSSRYLKSEQNYKINNEDFHKEQKKNKKRILNNHALVISKSDDNYQKIKYFKENLSKSSEIIEKQNKEVMQTQTNYTSDISNLDVKSEISSKAIKNLNNIKNKKIIENINEFEKKMHNLSKDNFKNNNRVKSTINFNSNYLNNENDNFFKNIKITDILDKDINSIIPQNLSQKNSKNLYNIREFANSLNSYVSSSKKSNNNLNDKDLSINNMQNNCKINNNIDVIKSTNNNKMKNELNPNRYYSVNIKQNPKCIEKIALNKIYNNNNANFNSNIVTKNNNISIDNIFDKKEDSKNIKRTKSYDIFLINPKSNNLNKNRDLIKRINSSKKFK